MVAAHCPHLPCFPCWGFDAPYNPIEGSTEAVTTKPVFDCQTCEDGTLCDCEIRTKKQPLRESVLCACVGFDGCPDCHRKGPSRGWRSAPEERRR